MSEPTLETETMDVEMENKDQVPTMITDASTSEDSTNETASDSSDTVDPMDVDKEASEDPPIRATENVNQEDTEDVIALNYLLELLKQGKDAGEKIKGKDILLLIGGTGAGKTTTALYLAGTKFEEVEVGGLDHYNPIDYPSPELKRFAVSDGATSVTVTINAATIHLPNGQPITICDTPGFGDTKGPELEISNGLGVIHALQGARSVKPVLVLDAEGMRNARYTPLRKTLQIVILMMGANPNFAAFDYIFTRCDQKKSKKIYKQLERFQESRKENQDDATEEEAVFDALVKDLIKKTKPKAINIEPEEEDAAADILEGLWGDDKERLQDPASTFVNFVSPEASDRLSKQLGLMLRRLETSLKKKDFESFYKTHQVLLRLAEALPLPDLEKAVEKGSAMGREFIVQANGQTRAVLNQIALAQQNEDFGKLVLELRLKLLALSQMDAISKVCQLPEEESYSKNLQATAERLFVGISNVIASVEDGDVTGQYSDLQGGILRMGHVGKALEGLLSSKELKDMVGRLTSKIAELIKQQLTTVEQDLESPSASGLQESKSPLDFLLQMADFLRDNASKNDWSFLDDRLHTIFKGLASRSEVCIQKLTKHTLDEDLHVPGWLKSLSGLVADCEVVGCRAFLLELSSFPHLLKEVNSARKDGEEVSDEVAAVAVFDGALSKGLTNFSQAAPSWTKTHGENKQVELKERKKQADKLLKSVQVAATACKEHRDSFSDQDAMEQAFKLLTKAESELERFVEKCNARPKKPEELLYGPAELGKQWHAMLLQLYSYKLQKGDCNVPRRYQKNKKLGRWVDTQRQQAKKLEMGMKSSMKDKRVEALAELDFEWSGTQHYDDKNAAAWERKLAALKKFKEEYGHCDVPQRLKGGLGTWVNNQRARKGTRLSPECVARLDALGFKWNMNK